MKTANYSYRSRVTSPYQIRRTETRSPVPKRKESLREEMQKLLGSHTFTATFDVDEQTASTFNGTDGLVPFICTLKMGDKVIGQGRGATVINQMNRFVMRSITFAYHSALIDAVVRATKLMDVFRPDAMPHPWSTSNAPASSGYESRGDTALASEKQRAYLIRLLQELDDESTRDKWMANLDTLTREEASSAIQHFSGR